MADNPTTIHRIEPEPAHEFYASLFPTKKRDTSTTDPPCLLATPTTPTNTLATRRGTHTIPSSSSPPSPTPPLSTQGQTYHRAFHNPPPFQSQLSLSSNNKGHVLLTRLGWKEESGGLGKRRQGLLEPVKTVWKRDCVGVGWRKQTARVTHTERKKRRMQETQQQDSNTERRVGMKKRTIEKKEQREEWENKRVRMMLNSDWSDEYEEILGLNGTI